MFRKEFLVCTLGNRLLNIQQHKALKCSSEVLRAQKSISYQNTFKIYLQSYSASDQPGQSMTTLAFWGLVISSFSFYEFIYYIFQCYFHTSKNHPQIDFISYFHSSKSITIYNYVLFNILACIFVAFHETITKDIAPS